MDAVLEVSNLKTYFTKNKKTIRAVDGIDFQIRKGETVALVGESGCGKSMTSLSIMGLVPAPAGKVVDGSIKLNGVDLVQMPEKKMYEIRGKEVAMIFQEPMTSLNPVLTIGDQLTGVIMHHLKVNKKTATAKAAEMLGIVGFSDPLKTLKDYPHRLSGGMRQRVMIAMAMSCNPKLLIADEPTTALDVTIQAQVLELMKDLSKKFSTSILLITHDLGVVSELAERVIVMYAGQIVEISDVDDLFTEPLHPYTEGLIHSVPDIEGDISRLQSIKGNVPAPGTVLPGCKFAPRCSKAFSRCTEKVPDMYVREDGRCVRCFLYDGEVEG
ncbi:ABC transporter ATP-binding protein [Bhargavaea beijingensis]|uniref:Peptide/nickel transport system ATP-binding protein n=1 Tax=Bhargavaea beijingensis TaxID=426756 RepID=A0A1G7A5D6_9BACL|nr:ABC transporter ATP-binding protein [Bhargavaea beijingensis]MCW1927272.1 ABC transporter ATP-binding protein [Bhargavaea beijingensis]SDE09265.1 peptide/nickel transport system ATP-binding protein [Bhargavaea beijingensis]